MNNIKKNNYFYAFILMMTIICSAIVFAIFFKPLYYLDLNWLNIKEMTNLSIEQIKTNYNQLIQYQSIFYKGPLILSNFIMSNSGAKHFQEVKVIFESIQVVMGVGIIISGIIIYYKIKELDFMFFKISGLMCVLVPTCIGLIVSINFNQAFIIFHQIIFRNNNWIFDERYDPVITILPEAFFMHCFVLIVILVLISSCVLLLIYKKMYRRILKEIDK